MVREGGGREKGVQGQGKKGETVRKASVSEKGGRKREKGGDGGGIG